MEYKGNMAKYKGSHGTKSLTICPICGNDILGSDLFCEICGMRIHSNKLNISKLESSSSQIFSEKQTLTFQNFSEWSKYWAELYVQNSDFWSYLIYEHIDDDDFSLPLIICAHKFQSLRDMKDAYITLCTYGQDRGFGMPNNDVFMCEEDLCWYVFLTCSDLPYVLLVADSFNGSIWGWADYFIPTPPIPISIGKSININAYNGGYAPIKTKRQMPNVKKIVQKHIDSKILKTIAHSKVNLRSRYIFYEERDFNNAKDAIYYGNRSIYDKLDWYGSWSNINGRDCVWRVDLFDDLTQDELEYAVGHIREHNGQYYKD